MQELAFRLSSENIPMEPFAAQSPGVRLIRKELARNGLLGRSFDNKCAHAPAISSVAINDGAPRR